MVWFDFNPSENAVKVALLILVGIVGLLSIVEVGLRSWFGFGRPLLYLPDADMGYLLAPNQRTRRFGNRIEINQYSMRGAAIAPTRPPQTLRVLLLGDSIANGGWWTDQNQTLSALLQQYLYTQTIGYQHVEVLNASANSWGPRNELAYLQKFGSFEAQVIVLLINTDDLFATTPTSVQVGRDRNYPNRNPPLALIEVIHRYIIKPQPIPELEAVQREGGDRVGTNLAAIEAIQTIAAQSNTQFLLVMTPLLREVERSGPRDYEKIARQRLSEFTQQQQIFFIDFLPIFNAAAKPNTLYRDSIHLSPIGNQQVVERIGEKLQAGFASRDR
jgi:lysophospholipase L1-like esterase